MGTLVRGFFGGVPAVAVIALACCAPSARTAWGTEPVTVTPTTASIPLVEGCTDGAYGAFVAWQEEGSPGQGVLRAQHLLATGDLDPAWASAGAIACSVVAARSELVALPDRLGGVYLLWKEGLFLYATRLDLGGAVAPGWPARGRSLTGVFADSPRPSVIEDGANGFYAAWTNSAGHISATHLGPANTGAGGWPNGTRGIGPADTAYWPQLALAPDGGIFIGWASASPDTDASPSAWRLRRLDSAGLNAAGWALEGVSFGSFHGELLGSPARGSLLGLSPDGRGGVFLLIGNPVGTDPSNGALLENRLYRRGVDGESAPDWPQAGRVMQLGPAYYQSAGSHSDYSYSLLPDGRDGALVGVPVYYDHGTDFGFVRCDGAGQWGFWYGAQVLVEGHEAALPGDGGLFLGSFYPTGAYGPYQPSAFVAISQSFTSSAWKGWTEYHHEPVIEWYGDVGLASTGDGGAVLFWSQVRERIGLFARRFNPAGEVTAVGPGSSPTMALSGLRFVPGVGVRATVVLPGADRARFELFDLAGRRIASQAIEAGVHAQREAPREDLTLEGTSALPSGLYFGRLVAGAHAIAGKLIVAR
jgi:hypothetical protein